MINGSKPCFERSSGAGSKAEAAGTAGVLFPLTPTICTPPSADAGCSTKELDAFASSTTDIPVGSTLFSVELRPEPTAEKKAVKDRLIPSPSPRPLPKGEGEPLGSSGRAECAKAFGRLSDGRAAVAPSFGAWDRSRHSPNLDEAFAGSPSPRGPRGRGRSEGEGFVRFSIASSILQIALIPPKIAKNLPVFDRSFVTNDVQNEFLRIGKTSARCGRIRTLRLHSPLLCLSFRRHTATKLECIIKARANVSPSPRILGARVGVRGNEANSSPRRTRTSGTVKLGESPRQSR